jgi:hypothetical protein
LSRLLPDLTSSPLLDTQQEIERVQFPSLIRNMEMAAPVAPAVAPPRPEPEVKNEVDIGGHVAVAMPETEAAGQSL